LFQPSEWAHVVTPLVSDSYEKRPADFSLNVKHKMQHHAILFSQRTMHRPNPMMLVIVTHFDCKRRKKPERIAPASFRQSAHLP